MHGAVGIHSGLVVGCIVVPGDAEHFTQIVIEIGKGGVGIHFELEFDVTVTVDKDKGWFDVEGTKVDSFANLDQVGQRYATLSEMESQTGCCKYK